MIEGHRMKQDDVHNKIIQTLNHKAKTHHQRQNVMQNVMVAIENKRHNRYNRWGLTGLALAAAITGIAVVPGTFFQERDTQLSMTSPKLTPQLADDLDMLLVLGEDRTHGS